MKIGSDENGEFTFIDIIALASFIVGIQNLDENITQNDLSEQLSRVVDEIHRHLEEQDDKIDRILEVINK